MIRGWCQVAQNTNSRGRPRDHSVRVGRGPCCTRASAVSQPGDCPRRDLVHNATGGQSKSIIKQVDSLVQRYLESERTIILAVVPATVDIATSDILERAHQVDPEGVRTVGVLTKLDLVGAGAEEGVVDILDNVRKPLNLGYVGVRCRSAADPMTNMTMATAVSEERISFETHPVFSRLRPDVRGVHPVFSRLRPDVRGVQTLTTKLTRVLVSRIRDAVPTMAAEVASQLKLTDEAMAALGGPPPATRAAQHEFFVTRLRIFAHLLSAAVSEAAAGPTDC
ncbi:hypothetical protein I4F81_009939 [Pyropia yezoensis]|uniref:Uncharacterized protein n=1 Tax=Pyropia yezoensis TaxID=2788 RepID=A0ACC3CCA8_PYRYE|nr:hypothetical protein I4F81_009939 [Neopyropia yezoensis]